MLMHSVSDVERKNSMYQYYRSQNGGIGKFFKYFKMLMRLKNPPHPVYNFGNF